MGVNQIRSTTGRLPVIGVLIVLALLATVLVSFGGANSRRAPIAALGPTLSPAPPTAAPSRSAPAVASLPPSSPAASPSAPSGQRFTVLPTGARFLFVVPRGWRIGFTGDLPTKGLRFITRMELGPTWDPIPAAWIDVSATRRSLAKVEQRLIAAGWSGEPEVIDSGALAGVTLTAGVGADRDPTALVRESGITYRITVHDIDGPTRASWLLDVFLAKFIPLGFES